jgi:hypothetical protein
MRIGEHAGGARWGLARERARPNRPRISKMTSAFASDAILGAHFQQPANPSIERTCRSGLRPPRPAAHVKR